MYNGCWKPTQNEKRSLGAPTISTTKAKYEKISLNDSTKSERFLLETLRLFLRKIIRVWSETSVALNHLKQIKKYKLIKTYETIGIALVLQYSLAEYLGCRAFIKQSEHEAVNKIKHLLHDLKFLMTIISPLRQIFFKSNNTIYSDPNTSMLESAFQNVKS